MACSFGPFRNSPLESLVNLMDLASVGLYDDLQIDTNVIDSTAKRLKMSPSISGTNGIITLLMKLETLLS